MENIIKYVASNKCCGCSACYQTCSLGAIKMSEDKHGFRVPIIENDSCVECGKCIKACPILNSDKKGNEPIACYAATNKSPEESYKCSSGGIFSVIAETVINEGGTVCGAAFSDDFKLKHVLANNISDLEQLKKSKYVQSDTSDIYKKVKALIANGRFVLFSGTPCQISGLYAFLSSDNFPNLLTVDVVCHGVPSQKLFDEYLKHISKNKKLENYTFRAKRNARNGMNCYFSYNVNGKNKLINWPEDSYNYYYMMGKTYRDSCYSCPFAKVNRVSDITLCDYWSWEKYHSKDFNKMECVSGVLINSDKVYHILIVLKTKLYMFLQNWKI